MKRNFAGLERGPFDLLVVGGGIYGAWTTYDAALRGLRVALVERHDWAAGTSSASSKLIHGGLRYLEHGHIGLVRTALEERKRLARLGPHRVRPLRFLLPTYRGDRVGRTRTRLGLWIYDRLAGRDQPVDPHRSLPRGGVLERYGFLRADGMTGGFTFGDCATDDARLVLEIVDGAVAAGAVAVNRARASRLTLDGRRVTGAVVEDLVGGRRIEVRAAVTANCAGAWCAEIVRQVAPADAPSARLTRGVHLVLPGMPTRDALLLPVRGERRVVFLIPWYGRTLLGTTDIDHAGPPEAAAVRQTDVAYLLAQANRVLREPWSEADVLGSFCGLRVLPGGDDRPPSELTREWALSRPLDGLIASVGGKLTSARMDAGVAVDRVLEIAGRTPVPCATEDRRFPWAPADRPEAWAAEMVSAGLARGLDEETSHSCLARYGTRIGEVLGWIDRDPVLSRRVVEDLPFCAAEIVQAFEGEMALDLDDALRRRLPLLRLGWSRAGQAERLAESAGALLGWSADRVRAEAAAIVGANAAPLRARNAGSA